MPYLLLLIDSSEYQRTMLQPFHGSNTGSNPVGDANNINDLAVIFGR